MILAVDVGGTKTLLVLFDDAGQIITQKKFPTSRDYKDFILVFSAEFNALKATDVKKTIIGIPGSVDREHGIGITCGNLPWKNVPIKADIEAIVKNTVLVENDAKLGGLGEALAIKNQYRKILYITIGTGIGISLITDGKIDLSVDDLGGKILMLEHDSDIVSWESFASGKAIVKRYGQRASDIDDPVTWENIADNFAVGIVELLHLYTPDAVVIGGGVGSNFAKFGDRLNRLLKQAQLTAPIPPVIAAQHPEEAVVYGCYEYAKQN